MFNSYTNPFGKVDKSQSDDDDLSDWICDTLMTFGPPFDFHEFKDPTKVDPPPRPLTQQDKANILDSCFHFANENFYHYEDDGDIEDRHESQDIYLELIEGVLNVL